MQRVLRLKIPSLSSGNDPVEATVTFDYEEGELLGPQSGTLTDNERDLDFEQTVDDTIEELLWARDTLVHAGKRIVRGWYISTTFAQHCASQRLHQLVRFSGSDGELRNGMYLSYDWLLDDAPQGCEETPPRYCRADHFRL